MAAKHSVCSGHVTLECGCRVCAVNGVNAVNGVIAPGHVAELSKFHARIHRLIAQHNKAEAKRPAPKVTATARRLASRKRVPLHVSKFHKHTRRCRIPFDQKPQSNGAYVVPAGVTMGYMVKGVMVETPKHVNLTIRMGGTMDMGKRRPNDSRLDKPFATIFPMFALEKCAVTGNPIPAKRVPAVITKTYAAFVKEQGRAA